MSEFEKPQIDPVEFEGDQELVDMFIDIVEDGLDMSIDDESLLESKLKFHNDEKGLSVGFHYYWGEEYNMDGDLEDVAILELEVENLTEASDSAGDSIVSRETNLYKVIPKYGTGEVLGSIELIKQHKLRIAELTEESIRFSTKADQTEGSTGYRAMTGADLLVIRETIEQLDSLEEGDQDDD